MQTLASAAAARLAPCLVRLLTAAPRPVPLSQPQRPAPWPTRACPPLPRCAKSFKLHCSAWVHLHLASPSLLPLVPDPRLPVALLPPAAGPLCAGDQGRRPLGALPGGSAHHQQHQVPFIGGGAQGRRPARGREAECAADGDCLPLFVSNHPCPCPPAHRVQCSHLSSITYDPRRSASNRLQYVNITSWECAQQDWGVEGAPGRRLAGLVV